MFQSSFSHADMRYQQLAARCHQNSGVGFILTNADAQNSSQVTSNASQTLAAPADRSSVVEERDLLGRLIVLRGQCLLYTVVRQDSQIIPLAENYSVDPKQHPEVLTTRLKGY